MIATTDSRDWWHIGSRLLPALALFALAGCGARSSQDLSAPQRLSAEVRAILGGDWPSPEYQRTRSRLEEMGPEVDAILVDVIEDPRARIEARADALVLLADRGSPVALPMLSRALGYSSEVLRSAAVLGLNVLSATSSDALELIRAATRDPARSVRLNALQSLNIREVETIRALLARETDDEVRKVALQLVTLAESRGAALAADRRGALRTAGDANDPQIVFRPVTTDSATGVSVGDLRLELPEGRDIPLSGSAIVVDEVVPAFFSPDRSAVVVESGGEIHLVEVQTRSIRSLGPGLAPRLVPFTQRFVFLREREGPRAPTMQGTELIYDVYQSSFTSDEVEHIGELHAWARLDRNAGASPVRRAVVADSGEGFVLEAENMESFALPTGVWTPSSSAPVDGP
ncbi:MAG: HEAT repeat domain-containing protein [Gemmatimonadota bacterium]